MPPLSAGGALSPVVLLLSSAPAPSAQDREHRGVTREHSSRRIRLEATLRRNAKLARAPGTKDFTQYGEARASPKDYYRHHLAAHCSAVVYADATALLTAAANLGYGLVQGEFG